MAEGDKQAQDSTGNDADRADAEKATAGGAAAEASAETTAETTPAKDAAKTTPAKGASGKAPAAKTAKAAKAPVTKTPAAKAAAAKAAKAPAAKTTPAKTTAAKTTPAKTTSAKATPAKGTPAKGTAAKAAPAKGPAAKSAASRGPAKGKPVKGRRPAPVAVRRSIPWGLVAATAALAVFAVAAIGYAVVKVEQNKPVDPAKGVADAQKIPGIFHENISAREHVTDPVRYDRSPPIGGNHDATWADCSGTVYTGPIRNENAVHTLEHGAVWITYQPNLAAGDVAKLKKLVDGKNYTLMSPYPGLKTPISLQAWGYQLYLNSMDEGLVKRFLKDLRDNVNNAPEPHGTCSDPDFKVAPQPPGPSPTVTATPSATVSPKPSGSTTASPTPTKP
jgi:hypothetical protein